MHKLSGSDKWRVCARITTKELLKCNAQCNSYILAKGLISVGKFHS